MGLIMRTDADGFEVRLVVRWAQLAAAIRGALVVLKALLIALAVAASLFAALHIWPQ